MILLSILAIFYAQKAHAIEVKWTCNKGNRVLFYSDSHSAKKKATCEKDGGKWQEKRPARVQTTQQSAPPRYYNEQSTPEPAPTEAPSQPQNTSSDTGGGGGYSSGGGGGW